MIVTQLYRPAFVEGFPEDYKEFVHARGKGVCVCVCVRVYGMFCVFLGVYDFGSYVACTSLRRKVFPKSTAYPKSHFLMTHALDVRVEQD